MTSSDKIDIEGIVFEAGNAVMPSSSPHESGAYDYRLELEEFHRQRVAEYFEQHTDPLFLPQERLLAKPKGQRRKEWEEFGDPRCFEGHYRLKANLDSFLRESPSWSQKRLADEMGTDEGTVSKWIGGKLYLSDRKLVEIAKLTGLSIPYLLDLHHVEMSIEYILDKGEYDRGSEHRPPASGNAYGPHEVDGFVDDMYHIRYDLDEELIAMSPESVFEQAASFQNQGWLDDGDYSEESRKLRSWVVWNLLGDARNPWHLESELHKSLLDLSDHFDDEGFFEGPNKVRMEAFESLASIHHSSSNLNKL